MRNQGLRIPSWDVKLSRHARRLFSIDSKQHIPWSQETGNTLREMQKVLMHAMRCPVLDKMVMRDSEEIVEEASLEIDMGSEHAIAAFQVSQESQASQEYEDGNAIPSDTGMLRAEQDQTIDLHTHESVHTCQEDVSATWRDPHSLKVTVPLRTSAEDSRQTGDEHTKITNSIPHGR